MNFRLKKCVSRFSLQQLCEETSLLASSGSLIKKVQVGKDQEKAQSEKDSHPKNRDGKKTN